MPSEQIAQLNESVQQSAAWVQPLRDEVAKVIVGQRYLVDRLIVGLVANGHVLLEGVPGLAKTLSISTLSRATGAHFQRIQFTPDLLPADIVGTLIYNPQKGEFYTKKGPIFANLILADEINRAPAKVQSALLEAMQERQVTIGDTSYPLPKPFLVLATENPIDQEGTYPLPEAQVDRFMLKLRIGYPSRAEELLILNSQATTNTRHEVNPVTSPEAILESRKIVDTIHLDDRLKGYMLDLVLATRDPVAAKLPQLKSLIQFGASPRATIALALAAKAWAFLEGRGYVVPQDVKNIAPDVLRHRVILSYEADAENVTSDDVVSQILATIPIP